MFSRIYIIVDKATSSKSYVSWARLTHEISKCKNFVHFSSLFIGHMSNGNISYLDSYSTKNVASVIFIRIYVHYN